jgi:hypothetical protein
MVHAVVIWLIVHLVLYVLILMPQFFALINLVNQVLIFVPLLYALLAFNDVLEGNVH